MTETEEQEGKQVVVEWSKLPAVGSGALVQARVNETEKQIRLSAVVVQPSAAGHVQPAYDHAGEAPRCYEGENEKGKWLLWFAWNLLEDARAQMKISWAGVHRGETAARAIFDDLIRGHLQGGRTDAEIAAEAKRRANKS